MEPKIRFKGFEGEWRNLSITEIASLKAGKSFNKLDAIDKPTVGYYPCYGGNGQRGYLPYYNQEGKYNIIGRQGALCGCINVAEGKFYATEHAVIVTPINVSDFEFLHESLIRANINQYATGAAQPGISVNNVNSQLSLNYPIYEEQKAIGKYFTSLDSQISASTSRLASLKQMKAASLQAMFPQEGETVPKIRFKGFEEEWKKVKLNSFAKRVTRKNSHLESTLALTIASAHGLVSQIDYFNNLVVGSNIRNYYLLKKGEFAYNKSYSNGYPFGSVKRLERYEQGILSTLYITFSIDNSISSDYLTHFFDTNLWHKEVAERAAEGARNHGLLNIGANDFLDINIWKPESKSEQQAIASYFTSLDRQISLQSQRLEKLKQIKSACLDKMFV